MARWCNEMPQFDGLFDFQNVLRPAFFTFRFLSRLIGDRLAVESSSGEGQPHLISAYEPTRDRINTLIWNFDLSAPAEVSANVEFKGLENEWNAWEIALDAATASNDENRRLRKTELARVSPQSPELKISLEPYAVKMLTLEKRR